MLVRSTVAVFGVEVPVSVRVHPVLRGGSLIFEPWRVEVFGSALPGGMTEQALAGANFAYSLEGLPYPIRISRAEVQEGGLSLSGEVRRLQLGGSGG